MATNKKALYKVHNGTDFDNIYFETSSDMVKLAAAIAGLTGTNIQDVLVALNNNTYKKADWGQSFAENSYVKLPNGLILQFGSVTVATGAGGPVTFPIQFPSSVRSIFTTVTTTGVAPTVSYYGSTRSGTNFTHNGGAPVAISWMAIGQ